MSIIDSKTLQHHLKLDKFGPVGSGVSNWLLKKSGISQLNDKYAPLKHLPGDEFLDAAIQSLGIKFSIDESELSRIPQQGAFITISNHPLGGADGIILMKLLLDIRPDFKVMGNYLLHQITPLQDYIFAVDPFVVSKGVRNKNNGIATSVHPNAKGLRDIIRHVREGKPLGVFPAGEVSNYQKNSKAIVDGIWHPKLMQLIKQLQVPIVRVYFNAENSQLFYRLARLHRSLQTAKLPSELLRSKEKLIQVRIGKAISVDKQQSFSDNEVYAAYLRQKTYLLGKVFDKSSLKQAKAERKQFKIIRKIRGNHPENKFDNKLNNGSADNYISSSQLAISSSNAVLPLVAEDYQSLEENNDINTVPIASPISKELILQDISVFNPSVKLFSQSNYDCYFAKSAEIPNILLEIGRLREVCFRNVGEGTNKAIDLDDYDQDYHHLLLWDNSNQQIVGAYRIGLGDLLYKSKGKKAFYTASLFKFSGKAEEMLTESIEMGRAFVNLEYQKKPMPLSLLWKGIAHITLRYPNYLYLIGGVSISNSFSDFSKSLMIDFMQSHYFDKDLSLYIRPKKRYRVKLIEEERDFIFKQVGSDLNDLDQWIDDIELGSLRLPVLLKKYIKQNAKLVAFNIDPKFNNCVDGFMYINIKDIPRNSIEPARLEYEASLH